MMSKEEIYTEAKELSISDVIWLVISLLTITDVCQYFNVKS